MALGRGGDQAVVKDGSRIQYYGGILQGVSAIFSAVKEVNGIPINSVYTKEDLPDYESFDYRNCPYCRQSMKLDALVNSYGYMQL